MSEPSPRTIPPGRIKLSYQDYLALPDDGKRYEIIEGDLYVTPSPTTRHQRISKRILFLLMQELEEHGEGEVFNAPCDVLLDEHNVIQPDLIFVRQDNEAIVKEKNIQGTPDLLVEIVSPSTRRTDVMIKSRLYARFQVPHYWIVDPDLDRIEAFDLSEEGEYQLVKTFSSPEVLQLEAFPNLKIPLKAIFR
ncbi:MAG TPA: Uma2 family endonuclease [Acidobacteriota bacterium]|nr:Uma2 family endonuclease [Acidobacteriota bacterium]